MDVRQALLDACVAEAAEAWLADPRDVAVYGRLVAAVEQRRRHLSGSHRDAHAVRGIAGTFVPAVMPSAAGDGDAAVVRHAEGADLEHSDGADLGLSDEPVHGPAPLGSRPAVRAVGADLAGDPAAVLRRLRGG